MGKTEIEAALRAALAPEHLEIRDRSEAHAGHDGADDGGHYELRIVSAGFTGQSPLARHRRVYGALDGMEGIHALAIQAHTPEEWRARQAGKKRPGH